MHSLHWSLLLPLTLITASSAASSNVQPYKQKPFKMHDPFSEKMKLDLIQFTANRFKTCLQNAWEPRQGTYIKICSQILQLIGCENLVFHKWAKIEKGSFHEFEHLYWYSTANEKLYNSHWARINADYCKSVINKFKSNTQKVKDNVGNMGKKISQNVDEKTIPRQVELKSKLLCRNFLLHRYTASVDDYERKNHFSFGFLQDDSEETVNWEDFITTLCTNFGKDVNEDLIRSMNTYIVMACKETGGGGGGVVNCADLEVNYQNCYTEEALKVKEKEMVFSLNLDESHLRPLVDWDKVSPLAQVLTGLNDGGHCALHLYHLISALKVNFDHETAGVRNDYSLDVRFFEEEQRLPAVIASKFHQLMRFVLLKLYFSHNPKHYFDKDSTLKVIVPPLSESPQEQVSSEEDIADVPEEDDNLAIATEFYPTNRSISHSKRNVLCFSSILMVGALAAVYKLYQSKGPAVNSTKHSEEYESTYILADFFEKVFGLYNDINFYLMTAATWLLTIALIIALIIALYYCFQCLGKRQADAEKNAAKNMQAKKRSTETYRLSSLLKPSPPTSQMKANETPRSGGKQLKRKNPEPQCSSSQSSFDISLSPLN